MLFQRAPQPEVEVVNAHSIWYHDLYHAMLRAPWWLDVIVIAAVFFVLNILFTVGYAISGGIAHANGFRELFFFSVQTMATIGYGNMFPETLPSHLIVTGEAITGILFSAVTTGVVFTKFSVPTARVQFAKNIVISPLDGVPTLMLRAANQRGNQIVEATVRISMMRTEHTKEGTRLYRLYDLQPSRERQPAFSRTWLIMHPLVEGSMLSSATPESLKKDEVEILVSITGIDETSAQTMHARHRYTDGDILWSTRYADMLSDLPGGRLQLDMKKFHDTVRVE